MTEKEEKDEIINKITGGKMIMKQAYDEETVERVRKKLKEEDLLDELLDAFHTAQEKQKKEIVIYAPLPNAFNIEGLTDNTFILCMGEMLFPFEIKMTPNEYGKKVKMKNKERKPELDETKNLMEMLRRNTTIINSTRVIATMSNYEHELLKRIKTVAIWNTIADNLKVYKDVSVARLLKIITEFGNYLSYSTKKAEISKFLRVRETDMLLIVDPPAKIGEYLVIKDRE